MIDYPKCSTCVFASPYSKVLHCTHKKLGEPGEVYIDELDDSLVYSYNEGGCFTVGKNFGCIHHKEKE
jgi:hypothetical protein